LFAGFRRAYRYLYQDIALAGNVRSDKLLVIEGRRQSRPPNLIIFVF